MKLTEPSSAIAQLKRKFSEIQDSLSMIEQKQTQLFRSIPEPPSRAVTRCRPASVDITSHPQTERENKRLKTQLEQITQERDALFAETQELKSTLAARNKVVSELTRANERLKNELQEERKAKSKMRRVQFEDVQKQDAENEETENSVSEEMPYMAMNLYALEDEPRLEGCLREKRNLLKQMNCPRPQQEFSKYYQDKSSRLAQQLLGR